MKKEELHPWEEFLNSRVKALIWAKNEFKYSNKQLADTFSMDEMQVYLILNSFDHPRYEDS